MKKQFKKSNLVQAAVIAGVSVVALAPIAASAATGTTTISSAVAPVVSMTTSGTVSLNVTPTSGGAQVTGNDTVTVTTNDSLGYTLSLKDTDATTTLADGSGNSIAASAGTPAAPVALAANTWGWRVDGLSGFGVTGTDTWAGISATDVQLKATAAAATAGDANTVKYAVKVDLSKPSGTYTDGVTYTAVAN